jgi:hypothetical protein
MLKKRNDPPKNPLRIKPWQKREWCIPPGANGEFAARMEDILDVYTRPEDERRPGVCMDECPKQ